ncbi:dsDNA nuclease domain-containing protein [Stappia sp. WLB 29]|uniref:dsDNA nuclease domain-containing protein n=1 Tax=Stappia sp. WLB 29 TaxID=2925220 RepID=UPI0020BDA533|nr:dsDNA nuclease domain-containing protein [Stappia sp. WLB 29]
MLDEVVLAMNNSDTSESGGKHNQKGIEFQKNWAIVKMFSLKEKDTPDFLVLFEVVQDIAILDSPNTPSTIEVFQVKKKDRMEWTWTMLTNLHNPDDPSKKTKVKKKKPKPLSGISDSPLGKIFASLANLKSLEASGCFISNAGCNLELSSGGNVATSTAIALSELAPHLADLLQAALDSVQTPSGMKADLSRVLIEKVNIPVDDAQTYTIGVVHNYLHKVSPPHAGQARSFVESLLAKLAPLGAKTAKTTTIEEIKSRHGYSLEHLNAALSDLHKTPDIEFYLNSWLDQLKNEGIEFWKITQIRASITAILSRKIFGSPLPDDVDISMCCDALLKNEQFEARLMPIFERGTKHLREKFPATKEVELQAHFLLKAVEQCVDPS